MFDGTRAWFRRNRTPLLITTGVLSATYLTGQYLLNKLVEARQRMGDDRIAKENLRRRFAQNQEDCTYTILALLPTATANVMAELRVEELTQELQERRREKMMGQGGSSVASSEAGALSQMGRDAAAAAEEAESIEGSFVRASQVEGLRSEGVKSEEQAKKSRVQLWEDVKVESLIRAITLIYTLALLTLFTRIQLNLLGRRSYLSSVVSLATPPSITASQQISLEDDDTTETQSSSHSRDFDINRRYLAFSWWLLHRGWRDLKNKVETSVRYSFGELTPRDSISFRRLSELIVEVRRAVEGETEEQRNQGNWLQYLCPPKENENEVLEQSGIGGLIEEEKNESSRGKGRTYSLRRLLDETSDIVESPTFSHVLTLCLDAGFSQLVDDKVATQAFKLPAREATFGSGALPTSELLRSNPLLSNEARNNAQAKLANILAVVTKQAHSIGSGGNLNNLMASSLAPSESALSPPSSSMPDVGSALRDANEYLAAMENVRDLEAFAAVVYSSNFELENLEAEIEAADSDSVEAEKRNLKAAEASLVDVGKELEGGLESAWAKATGE